MEKKEKCIRSETIYQGKILTLKKDTVLLPDQTEATREVVRHVYGACILAIDENRNVLLEEQYRYPYDETVLELPAGKSEPGETPEKTAVREFEEETGYKAKSMTLLGEFYPSCGYTDEIIYLFLADGLIKGKRHLDKDENLTVVKVPLDEVVERMKEGKIKDGKTFCCLSHYLLKEGK